MVTFCSAILTVSGREMCVSSISLMLCFALMGSSWCGGRRNPAPSRSQACRSPSSRRPAALTAPSCSGTRCPAAGSAAPGSDPSVSTHLFCSVSSTRRSHHVSGPGAGRVCLCARPDEPSEHLEQDVNGFTESGFGSHRLGNDPPRPQ